MSWNLASVIWTRKRDDGTVQVRGVPKHLGIPDFKPVPIVVHRGGRVYLSMLDVEVECATEADAEAAKDLLALAYASGVARSHVRQTEPLT